MDSIAFPSNASAPTPYTVSVGKATSPLASSCASARKIVSLEEALRISVCIRLKINFQQPVLPGKILVQVDGRFGKQITGIVQRLDSPRRFHFQENHPIGGEPFRTHLQQAPDECKSVLAAIQGKGG